MFRFSFVRIRRLWCAFQFRPTRQILSSAEHTAESFLNGTNSVYVEWMHESWLKDASSVHKVLSLVQSSQNVPYSCGVLLVLGQFFQAGDFGCSPWSRLPITKITTCNKHVVNDFSS